MKSRHSTATATPGTIDLRYANNCRLPKGSKSRLSSMASAGTLRSGRMRIGARNVKIEHRGNVILVSNG